MIKLTAFLLFSIMFGINPVNDDSTKNIINHDWKLNIFALGKGMIPIGQFENNKPIKAIAMMGIKFYWLKEFQIARDINNISDRNRGFWCGWAFHSFVCWFFSECSNGERFFLGNNCREDRASTLFDR